MHHPLGNAYRSGTVNLRQLQYLIAIAETGSFRAGAQRLHVAPPSISQQIRLLELEVGGPLLERLPRGARLTPAGRAFLPEARGARAGGAAWRTRAGAPALALEPPRSRSRRCSRSRSGCCRPRSSGCARRTRASRCGCTSSPTASSSRPRSTAGVGDIAIGPSRAGPARPVRRRWATRRSSSSSAAGTRRSPSPGPVRLDALADDAWVLFPAHARAARLVVTICASAGFEPRDAVRTAQVEAVVRLAAAGLGVAIVPANIVPPHLAAHVARSSTRRSSASSSPTPASTGRRRPTRSSRRCATRPGPTAARRLHPRSRATRSGTHNACLTPRCARPGATSPRRSRRGTSA